MKTIQLLENAYNSLIELSKINGNAAIARRDLYLAIEKLKVIENNLHSNIVEQWEKDFGSPAKDVTMDAYTVSGFMQMILKTNHL